MNQVLERLYHVDVSLGNYGLVINKLILIAGNLKYLVLQPSASHRVQCNYQL